VVGVGGVVVWRAPNSGDTTVDRAQARARATRARGGPQLGQARRNQSCKAVELWRWRGGGDELEGANE